MERQASPMQYASSQILQHSNSLQVAIKANLEALGTLLYDETQQTFALKERIRELEAQLGLPASEAPTEHVGTHIGRILQKENAGEALISLFWAEKQKHGLLADLLGKDNRPAFVSQRDATVAATVIQWLASHAGECFLRDFIERSGGRFLKDD